jgi:tetratricopeptide (TPR) repeat protein
MRHGMKRQARPPGHLDAREEDVIYDLCSYLIEAGMTPQAATLLKQFVTQRPDHAWANVLLGKCLAIMGQHNAALEALWEAIGCNPRMIDARFHAALLAKRLGDCEQAMGHLKEVILLNPKDARAYNLMGECCREMGLRRDAELFFAQARRLAPDFEVPITNLRSLWAEDAHPHARRPAGLRTRHEPPEAL